MSAKSPPAGRVGLTVEEDDFECAVALDKLIDDALEEPRSMQELETRVSASSESEERVVQHVRNQSIT